MIVNRFLFLYFFCNVCNAHLIIFIENAQYKCAVEAHHFSDAAVEGYGQCRYLRLISELDQAHCSFIVEKARVTPLKYKTIPRLEFAAALPLQE